MSDTNLTLNYTIVTPDPDIAGPGVMTGFIASGVVATLASVLHHFLPSPPEPPPPTEALLKSWRDLVEEFIQSLSDQQLITGLLLVSLAMVKYWDPNDLDNLSIAGDLAFFSIITHFATVLTLKKRLRERPKLARIRMGLVFMTLLLWIIITSLLVKNSFIARLFINIGALGWFSLVISIVDMVGATWVFWDICLLLFVAEDALEARKAIGQGLRPISKDQEAIARMLKRRPISEDQQVIKWVPKQGYSQPLLSMLSSLLSLFNKFCELYLKRKNRLLQALLWVLAEIIFPIRFGYILLSVLLLTGIINVILDMVMSGLQTSWGFGQLLPAFMLLLPLFSLAQSYAESKSKRKELESENAIKVPEKSRRELDGFKVTGNPSHMEVTEVDEETKACQV